MTPEERNFIYEYIKPGDYWSPKAIAERVLAEIEPYFKNKISENMKNQDKRWNELSEESKEKVKKTYDAWLTDTIFSEDFKKRAITLFHNEYGKHNLKPLTTYVDVAKELFKDGALQFKTSFFSRSLDNAEFNDNANPVYSLNLTSQKHAEKLLAINQLLNVAQYLNKNEYGRDWSPDWENMSPDEKVWSLGIDENTIRVYYVQKCDGTRPEIVYFHTMEIAQQAIEILGEETIKIALGNY